MILTVGLDPGADNRIRRSTDWMAADLPSSGYIAMGEVAVMGEDVDSRNFTRQDRQQYRGKVRRCLDVLAADAGRGQV